MTDWFQLELVAIVTKQAPFQGENMSPQQVIEFWNNYADNYTSLQQGDMPERIVNRLFEAGVLKSDYSVLEIGSGPGTYSLKLAPKVRILTCMDSSENMLDILFKSVNDRGYTNVERFLADWNKYTPKKGYDACIATLCPGSGSEESLLRMERSARRSCIIVSWYANHGDYLNEKIWKELGRDYSYDIRKSTGVQDWLEEHGRDFKLEMFSAHIIQDVPLDEMIAREKSAFKAYGQRDVEDIVRKLLEPCTKNGMVRFDHVNEMKLIYWEPAE